MPTDTPALRFALVHQTFRALRHPNYRLYFAGQAFSLVGTWMQIVAAGWLVLRITNSPLLLGLVTAMESLPALFFSLMAGALADVFDKRRIAIVTQSLSGLQALALGALVLTNHATFWSVFWLASFAGMINAFDLPIRQSLIFDIVGAEDLVNASALNSVVFNVARIVGPAIAATIIVHFGEGANFIANAASYAFVVTALVRMRTLPQRSRAHHRDLAQSALNGIAYVVRHPLLARMFLALFIYSIFGFNYILLMPVIAKLQLHGTATALGFLLSSLGVGALAGSLTLAMRGAASLRSLLVMSFVFPASLIAFAFARTLHWASFLAAVLGFCMVQFIVRFSTFLQTGAKDAMRGRVLGLYNMFMMGLAPIGALQAGALAERFGAGTALLVGGVLCLFASLLLALPQHTLRKEAGQPQTAAAVAAK